MSILLSKLSEDEKGTLAHLTTTAEIRPDSSMNCYSPLSAPINFGASYHFILSAVIDHLRLKAIVGNAPLTICTIDSTHIPVHGIYRQTLRLQDASRADYRLAAILYTADIMGYNVILRMFWLTRQNPDIHWDQNHWYWRTRMGAEDGLVCL